MKDLKFLCLLYACFFLIESTQAHEALDLSGTWQFSIDRQFEKNSHWIKQDFDTSNWKTLTLPGNWDKQNEYAHFSVRVII